MQRAIDLAGKGEGYVEPNPMVGCVIVRGRQIVGEGYHRRFGGPHAEIDAIRTAGKGARRATAYVNLEPCSHVGKTPPCAEALIRTGFKRVVVAMRDPNPLVAGRGLRILRASGIRVETGLLRKKAAAILAPFLKFHAEARPYVIAKWAQSIDGKIATRTGDSKWITSKTSRAAGHALRARVDGVVVGVETVLADDPDLTARMARPRRVATRIVLDRRLRTPMTSKLVKTARRTPTLIVTTGRPRTNRAAARRRLALERAGCEVLGIRSSRQGLDLDELLAHLHAMQMTNILIEGGGKVLGSFVGQNLADEARIFVAPRLIGGERAPGPLRHMGPALMTDIAGCRIQGPVRCGPDICYTVKFDRGG